MLHRIALAVAIVMTISAAAVAPATALERKPYDAATLAADQKAGRSILLHVTAPWCPTCKAQKVVIEKLAADPAYKDFVIVDLDFDTGGQALRALNARSQSTLIAWKGEKETGRSAGETSADGIAALMKSAL